MTSGIFFGFIRQIFKTLYLQNALIELSLGPFRADFAFIRI